MANSGQVARRQEMIQKLVKIWTKGGFKTAHELAVRFDVSDVTMCTYLKRVKAIVQDEFLENAKEDFDKQVLRLETLVEEGWRDHEMSCYRKRICRLCFGKGQDEEKKECIRCEGEGYKIERQAGDSKHLTNVLKTVQEICRLKGYHPEKTKKLVLEGPGVEKLFIGVDADLVIEHKRLMDLMSRKKSGDDNIDVVDVAFEETEEGEKK